MTPERRRPSAACATIGLFALALGCTGAGIPTGNYACQSDRDCAAGFACAQSVCTASGDQGTTTAAATTGGAGGIGATTGTASGSTTGATLGTTGAGATTGGTQSGTTGSATGSTSGTTGATSTDAGCGSGPVCLEVTAWFDGESQLNIQGSNVWWVNLYDCVPGEGSYSQSDTTLTSCGVDAGWCPWWPVAGAADGGWNYCQQMPAMCSIYGAGTSSPFTTLTPPLPAAAQPNLTFTPNACRDSCSLVQTPDSTNSYTAIVDINDVDSPGAALYDITLCYDP